MRVSKEKAVELAKAKVEKVEKYFNRAKAKYEEALGKLQKANENLAMKNVKTETSVEETATV